MVSTTGLFKSGRSSFSSWISSRASKDEFAQALRSVGEPIFGQSIKDISGGNLLAQLFEITEKFNMATQPPLLLLQKTMVVVEGVARKLYPETNIWEDLNLFWRIG